MDNREIAIKVAEAIDARKGKDIIIIDMMEKSSFADYFILASGKNERQIDGFVDEAEKIMQGMGLEPKSKEGKAPSGWILMDYGDIIINFLTESTRDRYNIEKVWGDCEFIYIGDNLD